MPAMGVLAEVDRAIEEIRKDPLRQVLWQQIFQKYPPAFIMDCERQIEGTREMVTAWLRENMLAAVDDPAASAAVTVAHLMNYKGQTEHGQHYLQAKCQEIGLTISRWKLTRRFKRTSSAFTTPSWRALVEPSPSRSSKTQTAENWNVAG